MIFTKKALVLMGRSAAQQDVEDGQRGVSRSAENPSCYWRMLQVLNAALDEAWITYEQERSYREQLSEAYEAHAESLLRTPIQRAQQKQLEGVFGNE